MAIEMTLSPLCMEEAFSYQLSAFSVSNNAREGQGKPMVLRHWNFSRKYDFATKPQRTRREGDIKESLQGDSLIFSATLRPIE